MISVAIPTMNRPADLRRCLASILAGSRMPREVIVVDQSADDASLDVVRSLGSDLVRHVAQQPPSQSAARNRAADEARGRYVAYLDDDAEVPPDWLASLESELERLDWPDAIYGEVRNPPGHDAGGLIGELRFAHDRTWVGRAHPGHIGWGCHMIVRREVCAEIGGFDLRLGCGSMFHCADELDFNYRLLAAGRRAASTPAFHMTHHHRQWEDAAALPRMWYRYSYGNAAFSAKHMRRRDPFAAYMLARQVAADVKVLAGGIRRRSALQRRVGMGRLRGTSRGVLAGWREYGRATG